MKVLLYYATSDVGEEYLKYPLGLLYLGAMVRNKHEVKFYDSKVDTNTIENVVESFDPDVIAISFTSGSTVDAFTIANKFPEKILMAGGFHPTVRPQECLENGFNVVVRGEGEYIFSSLLNKLEKGESISGIYEAERIKNLDELSFPARSIIPKEYFKIYNQAAIIGSRGCEFSCNFCGSAKSGLIKRSPKNIVSELEEIVLFHNNQPIHFCDNIFTHDLDWANEIAEEIIKRELEIRYSINSRCNIPDTDIFEKLKQSGCEWVSFGIESGSQEILNRISKKVTIRQIEDTVLAAKKAGLKTRTSWIIGLPGDYKENLMNIYLMKKILPDQIHITLNTPYPGSRYGENPEKYGIHLIKNNWSKLFNNLYAKRNFSEAISFDYLNANEIRRLVSETVNEMQKLGYTHLKGNDSQNSRTIRTFLDKKLMDF